MKKIIRIIIPLILLVVAVLYINSAFFSAWVSGGPPNDYPEAWAYRSLRHLFYSVGFIILAITTFLTLKPKAKKTKIKCIIGVLVALCLFTTPHIKKFLEIDDCLDQGGRWNEEFHRCEK